MATAQPAPATGTITVELFGGDRRPFAASSEVLVQIRDGNQRDYVRDWYSVPTIRVTRLPIFQNFTDSYTVLASAKGHVQAGFWPVKIAAGIVRRVDLMLVSRHSGFRFPQWSEVRQLHPAIRALLKSSADYDEFRETKSLALATCFNLTTALASIHLGTGTPLDAIRVLIELRRDRFFAWADPILIDKVEDATAQGLFEAEPGAPVFHPGATRSYKETRFGEANVQITFHEDDRQDGMVKVEFDMDYYRDRGAHALLEVVPNTLFKRKTDPARVYVLRWMAGRQAGVAEFEPPYTIT